MNGRSGDKKRFKYAGKPAAYRGLLRCHQCGCSMTPDPKKRKLIDGTYNKHFYYHCTNYHRTHDKVLNIKESEIDEQVASVFKQLEIPQDKLKTIVQALKEAHEHKNQFYKTKIDHYKKEIARYEKRRSNAYDDRIEDRITWDQYEKIRKESDLNMARIEDEISKLNYAEKEYYLTTARLVELGSRTAEIFLRSKPMEKRQLFNFVLSNATIDERKLRYTVKFPFNLVLKYAPSSSWLPR